MTKQKIIRFVFELRNEQYAFWRLMVLSSLVGLVAGLGAMLFHSLLAGCESLFLHRFGGWDPSGPDGAAPLLARALQGRDWRIALAALAPFLGGLISGLIVWRFAPEAEGHGTDNAIDAFHHRGGRVRARVPFVKTLTSALTIGSGGSGGQEGPIAQIGSGFGSLFATRLRLSTRERRILMAAGMAGGIGSIFRAPIAGALFAAEVLYRDMDMEYEVLIPSIFSSVVAYAVFASRFGWQPLFAVPDFVFNRPVQLLAYFVLAIVVALGAILYIKAFYGAKHAFERLGWPLWIRPAAGGLIVGLIALAMPWAMGTSDAALQHVLTMQADAIAPERFLSEFALLAGLAAAKILATACAIGSGGSGGVFGPAVVTGGLLGAATGLAAAHLFPGLGIQPGAFALVGMGGFFAAAGKTPISTIIMVSEITGNYRLLVPTMWVCMIAYVLTRRHGLYEKQLKNRLEAPAHRGEMMEAVLRQLCVRDVLSSAADPALRTVNERTSLRELVARFAVIEQSSVPVVRDNGLVTGLILSRELRAALAGGRHLGDAVIAADLAHPPVVVTREDTLLTAIHRITSHNLDEIAVVSDYTSARFIGILSRRHIVSAYYAALTTAISA